MVRPNRSVVWFLPTLFLVACSASPEPDIEWDEPEESPLDTVDSSALSADCAQLRVSGVSASTQESINPASSAVDGSLATRWSGYGSGASLTLDLGTVRKVCALRVAWHRGSSRTSNFEIRLSGDNVSYAQAYKGVSSGMTTNLETYAFTEANARYVRLVVAGNTENLWASVTEAQVIGSSNLVVAPAPPPAPPPDATKDPFGIRKLYGTVSQGREYYMNANATTLTQLEDGGKMGRFNSSVTYNATERHWTVNGSQIRFVMTTPSGAKPWRNVEMTMEVRMRSGNLLQPYARGEEHSTDVTRAYRGSANKHRIWFDAPARIGYMKELYHHSQNHGYASANKAVKNIGDSSLSLMNRWVRIKTITYNLANNTQAKFETWVDLDRNDNWRKVTEYIDGGGWWVRDVSVFNSFMSFMRANHPTVIPRDRDTGLEIKADEPITWGGNFVSWRSDGATYDFRNLSAREIDATQPLY